MANDVFECLERGIQAAECREWGVVTPAGFRLRRPSWLVQRYLLTASMAFCFLPGVGRGPIEASRKTALIPRQR